MANLRPKIQVPFGRANEPIVIPNNDLILSANQTFLVSDNAAGLTTLTVKQIQNFRVNQILLVGEVGNQGSEIVKTHASTPPSGSTITLAAATAQPHSAGTNVYVANWDQVEISSASTVTGSKTVLVTTLLSPGLVATPYNDTAGTTGFYFARWKNSINSTFSSYSDGAPVAGYTPLMARRVIDNALQSINKEITPNVITDEYAFREIDNCQMEVLKELKRWSFMQSYDSIVTQLCTGMWFMSLPTDVDDQNTNKSIYRVRIGREQELTWIDKDQLNKFVDDIAYTTTAQAITAGASTITLTNSNDFTSSGTIRVRTNNLAYSSNNKTTGVITLSAGVTVGTPYAAGVEAFEYPTLGLPRYWTVYGGKMYIFPITASTYSGRNVYMDYYKSLTQITTDTDTLVIPDPTVVQYYLEWKFLKRINNGNETEGSLAAKANYIDRRERMKQKEVMNRNFVMRPRYNNFAVQSEFDNGDNKQIRTGSFDIPGF